MSPNDLENVTSLTSLCKSHDRDKQKSLSNDRWQISCNKWWTWLRDTRQLLSSYKRQVLFRQCSHVISIFLYKCRVPLFFARSDVCTCLCTKWAFMRWIKDYLMDRWNILRLCLMSAGATGWWCELTFQWCLRGLSSLRGTSHSTSPVTGPNLVPRGM